MIFTSNVQTRPELSCPERAGSTLAGVRYSRRTGLQHRLAGRLQHRDRGPQSYVYRSQGPGRCRRAGAPATGGSRPCFPVLCCAIRFILYQVPVWAVLDYTNTRTIARELLLVKVSILGPEYLEEQLTGGPSHQPRQADHPTKLEREAALAHNFERSGISDAANIPLTPSQALRLKHQHLHSISVLASQFGAKIVDVSSHSVIVELTAKTNRVEAFLSLVKPFGVLEAARTGKQYHSFGVLRSDVVGLMAMPRTPLDRPAEEDAEDIISDAVDASLLPPG